MLCDKCGKRRATVHYQQVINGVAKEEHLCSECAGGWGGFGTLDLNKLFSSAAVQQPGAGVACPQCGMTLSEFKSTGRLGCSRCYQVFAQAVKPLITRYHGQRRHKGKIKRPLKYQGGGTVSLSPPDGALADKTYEKLALQKQLAELVELEKFEEAAAVRDKLRAVEAELSRAAGQKAGEQK